MGKPRKTIGTSMGKWWFGGILRELASGKLKKLWKITSEWENSLFLGSLSIAMLICQMVTMGFDGLKMGE